MGVGADMSRQEQPEPELVLVDATPTVVVAGVVEEGEIRDHFDRSFALLAAVMGKQGLAPTPTTCVPSSAGWSTDTGVPAHPGLLRRRRVSAGTGW
jgi:hypothetical protein